jgi:hypothetical protein
MSLNLAAALANIKARFLVTEIFPKTNLFSWRGTATSNVSKRKINRDHSAGPVP